MKNLERRIWLTAAVMLLCYFGTMRVRAGYLFEVAPLPKPLNEIPLKLDEWTGVDSPIDIRVQTILNAQESMSRVYQNRDGAVIGLNISAWLRPETISDAAPHVPKLCYTNAGWRIIAERAITVGTPRGDMPLTSILLERQSERIVVAYWYQMGDSFFNSVHEARRIHRGLWGRSSWPATVKVLLQTNATNIDAGLPQIKKFAQLIERELVAEEAGPSVSR